MAKRARNAAWILAVLAAVAPATAAHAGQDDPLTRRVRTTDARIAALIEQAGRESATFRRMLETINGSDTYVFISDGRCRHDQAACFVAVRCAGVNRMMFVTVDMSRRSADWDVMGSIGHELRHTIEAISDPTVKSNADQYFLYERIGFHSRAGAFETQDAIDAGNIVRDDVRRFRKENRR